MAVKNIMIVGVGGQGTLLTSRILGGLTIAGGYDVKLSEVHGMAQRGGSVVTFVRYGDKVAEPIVEEGQADVIIAFERLEALRYAHFLKKDGVLIVNDWRIDPMPVVIGSFMGVDSTSTAGRILSVLSSNNWCNPSDLFPTIGLLIYIVLVVLFAYFYTSITFNPLEIANNMKKNGGFIPGVRPGKPTSDYLNHILNYVIFIGAIGLLIACVAPIIVTGISGMGHLSFTGTSLIIIVSVIVETIKSIESQLLVRNYKGFLND